MARWRVGAALAAASLMVSACGSDSDPVASGGAPTTSAGVATTSAGGEATQQKGAGDGKKIKVALSNSFIGNQWRVEMANVFEAACAMPPYKESVDCSVFHSGNDVGKQTQQLTNLISQRVDAIALNAASPTGLNGVVKQACERDIVVVTFDAAVTEPCAVAVNVDQAAIGRAMAEWLVEQMGGSGDVLFVTGVAGTSIDQERNKAAKEVFNKAGVKIVAEYAADWDAATAQRKTAAALPSMAQVDGIWASGGTPGVLQAFKDAGRKLPPTAGESENGFRKMMAAGEVVGYSTGTPPYLSVMALELARAIATGQAEPKSITIPAPVVTNDGIKEGVNVFAKQPDSFFNTFTDSGEKAAVTLCIEAALDGKPCDGELTVDLGQS